MAPRKPVLLAAPITAFRIPVVSWIPKDLHSFHEWHVTYSPAEHVEIHGTDWLLIKANLHKNASLGVFLLPVKYYDLWRRLIYGALWWEKMYLKWEEVTRQFGRRQISPEQEQMVNMRNNCAVRLVQYLLSRRIVLQELMNLRFNKDQEPVIASLIEFGIRDFRDWLCVDFDTAHAEGKQFLKYDPTVKSNRKLFNKGFGDLAALDPPHDDDEWWGGEFEHLDFDDIFDTVKKTAPGTLLAEEFASHRSVLGELNAAEPEGWTEKDIPFFSKNFLQYIQETGNDPRDHKALFLRYAFARYPKEDVDEMACEVASVFGSEYEEERMGGLVDRLVETSDLEDFLSKLGLQQERGQVQLPTAGDRSQVGDGGVPPADPLTIHEEHHSQLLL